MTNPAEMPDPDRLHDAMVRRLHRRAVVTGDPAAGRARVDRRIRLDVREDFQRGGQRVLTRPGRASEKRPAKSAGLCVRGLATVRYRHLVQLSGGDGAELQRPARVEDDRRNLRKTGSRPGNRRSSAPSPTRVWVLANEAADPGAFPVPTSVQHRAHALALARRGHRWMWWKGWRPSPT